MHLVVQYFLCTYLAIIRLGLEYDVPQVQASVFVVVESRDRAAKKLTYMTCIIVVFIPRVPYGGCAMRMIRAEGRGRQQVGSTNDILDPQHS